MGGNLTPAFRPEAAPPPDRTTFSSEAAGGGGKGSALGGLLGGLSDNFGGQQRAAEPQALQAVSLDKKSEELGAQLREDVRSSVTSVTGEMLATRGNTRVDQISLSNEIMGDVERERHIELPTPQSTKPEQILCAGETLIDNHQIDKGPEKGGDPSQPEKRNVRQEEFMERVLSRSTSVSQFRKRDEGNLRGIISGNLDRRSL